MTKFYRICFWGSYPNICSPIAGKLFIDPDEPQTAMRSRFKKLGKFETMYIVADLETEIVLATIKYRAHDGLLIVYPDFNDIEINPYFREINSDSRHIYQYAIQNLSSDHRQYDWSLRNDMDKLAAKVSIYARRFSAK